MLSTREEILATAEKLAAHLNNSYRDIDKQEWTDHIFEMLRSFCGMLPGAGPTLECFHGRHPDGNGEFLWDFIATTPERGIVLAAESEQKSHTQSEIDSLKHDFEKLLYVYSPLRLLVCKAKSIEHAHSTLRQLEQYAGRCCRRFNPGSVFLIHFCLWSDELSKGSGTTFLWQSSGKPAPLPEEPLDFTLVTV